MCFYFDGQLDEHTDGVAVIADFFTGDSKEKALNQAAHKTLLVLLHGRHLCDRVPWTIGAERGFCQSHNMDNIWIDMNFKAVQSVVIVFSLPMTGIKKLSGVPYSSVLLQASTP